MEQNIAQQGRLHHEVASKLTTYKPLCPIRTSYENWCAILNLNTLRGLIK